MSGAWDLGPDIAQCFNLEPAAWANAAAARVTRLAKEASASTPWAARLLKAGAVSSAPKEVRLPKPYKFGQSWVEDGMLVSCECPHGGRAPASDAVSVQQAGPVMGVRGRCPPTPPTTCTATLSREFRV